MNVPLAPTLPPLRAVVHAILRYNRYACAGYYNTIPIGTPQRRGEIPRASAFSIPAPEYFFRFEFRNAILTSVSLVISMIVW
jgi:hypothetical protein